MELNGKWQNIIAQTRTLKLSAMKTQHKESLDT